MPSLETSNFAYDALLFVTVIDCQSFTGAGEKLGISKSVVSKRVRRLEAHLALQLLHRSTRKLAPTEAGRDLYRQFAYLKKEMQKLENRVRYHSDEPAGKLRVHGPVSFGVHHLAPIIQTFTELYPKIEVEMYLGRQFSDVIANAIDVSIHVGRLKDSELYQRKLFSSPLTVCASPVYLKKQGYPKTPHGLLQHNCLRYHVPSIGNEWYFKIDGAYQLVRVTGNFSASNANTLEAAAISGQGIVMLPEYVVSDAINKGLLIRLLANYCSSHVDVSLVYSEREHMAPKVRVFLDYLIESFAAM